MAEAAHGTAPSLHGKNVANPMAMILAGACAARRIRATRSARRPGARSARRLLEAVVGRRAARPTSAATHGTTEFTDDVIRRVRTKLEVWATL